MTRQRAQSPTDKLTGTAIVLAPILLGASTVAMLADGDFNASQAGGVIQFFAFSVFAVAMVGLTRPLQPVVPRTAAVLLFTGVVGAATGASWGVDSIWAAVTGEPSLLDQGTVGFVALGPHGIAFFPGSLIALGVLYARAGIVRPGVASAAYLLVAAGVLFPVGRAAEIPAVALGTDVLMLIPLAAIGVALLRRESAPYPQGATASI